MTIFRALCPHFKSPSTNKIPNAHCTTKSINTSRARTHGATETFVAPWCTKRQYLPKSKCKHESHYAIWRDTFNSRATVEQGTVPEKCISFVTRRATRLGVTKQCIQKLLSSSTILLIPVH